MDFSLSSEAQAIKGLTVQVLSDMSTHEHLRALEQSDNDNYDRDTWQALVQTGVAACAIPEAHGGSGLSFLALAAALEEVGRYAAAVPLLTSSVMGAMPIAHYGTPVQQQRWLPALASGDSLACAVLSEDDTTTAHHQPDGTYLLSGTKPLVAGGIEADVALVPAQLDTTVGVFLLPIPTPGLTITPVQVTSGWHEARFELTDVQLAPDALLGTPETGTKIINYIEQHTHAGIAMMAAGSAKEAIRLAAEYTRERHQFDRPIATFQAVSQRAGDSYIDAEAIWLTAYQAAWRLAAGLPAEREIAIASYTAAEAGHRVIQAATHVHGGVGVDRDYPLHRHFLSTRHRELTLGHSEDHLTRLGDIIATR